MLCMLMVQIFFVVGVLASEGLEIVQLNASAPQCLGQPITQNSRASLRSTSCRSFLQLVVVPTGQVAHVHFTNRDAFCALLTNEQKPLANVTSNGSSDINFCTSEDRAVTVPSGTHYIRVANSPIPLRVSVTYLDTALKCHDIVSDALIGVPLSLEPTEHKCTIVLPARTILEIRRIDRTEHEVQDPRNCARVRMGRAFYSLNRRWPAVCEIPADDTYEYQLGCSAAVLDASSLAIVQVVFTLHQIDNYKAMTSPLMCALEKDNLLD